MDTSALLQQIKNLEQMIMQQQTDNNNRSNNNIPMMSTGNSDDDVPDNIKKNREQARQWRVKNLEYRRQYDRLSDARQMIEKKMRDLRKEYGIAERARPVRSKKRR